ncbi:unnamed protein product [Allacma fusca]|uniref:Chromo domain-containing protein n=1 Tax=Allacma fusca TaxID=39272 RepID=A0A8J2LD33_9HEXA|nr:unnamed protein product [Allacma fusca]
MKTETGLLWPAKVMRKDGNRFDVILFGGNHPRVWVVEEDTVDEMASPSSSEPGFREALQELHQFLNVSSNQSIYELGDSVKINICESNTNRRPKPLKNVRKKLPRKVPIIKQQMDAHSSSAEDEWEVEQILATKCVNGLRYYWISWKGYPESLSIKKRNF